MKIKNDMIVFSTNTIRYANLGLIGLSENMDQISGGYDESVWRKGEEEYTDALTKDELIELADYMISLWIRFKSLQKV
jgi:hypothetical protein